MSRADRARELRYRRPALASAGYHAIWEELEAITEDCQAIHWFVDRDDETLLNALDGDEGQVWEFKAAFADLEAKAERLTCALQERFGCFCAIDDPEQYYNDRTVALIGNQYQTVGYDAYEEDYLSMTGYEQDLACTEAGKRLMRTTKAEIIASIGQCVGILLEFQDLRQQHDCLKAAFDVLRGENTYFLKQIREIEAAYEAANAAEWDVRSKEVRQFNRLLGCLPDRAWVE